ncbi:mCG147330, partial [Mus musculus]
MFLYGRCSWLLPSTFLPHRLKRFCQIQGQPCGCQMWLLLRIHFSH